jgi:hypothetical protein
MGDPIVQHVVDWALIWKIVLSIVSCLAVIVGWFIKRWMNRWDGWKEEIDKQGGIVTRDIFFRFCDEKQAKCSVSMNCKIEDIVEWRNAMFEKGGPMLIKNHDEMCDKVTSRAAATFAKMVDEKFDHHRELVTAQFGEFGANLQRKLIEIVAGLKKDLLNNDCQK